MDHQGSSLGTFLNPSEPCFLLLEDRGNSTYHIHFVVVKIRKTSTTVNFSVFSITDVQLIVVICG